MELYIQMGHGMENMCVELLKHWGDGTIVFSPLNTNRQKLPILSSKYHSFNGRTLFDPQLYYPKDGAEKLKEYDYWPIENSTISENATQMRICRCVFQINEEMNTDEIILPGTEMDIDSMERSINWISFSAGFFRAHTNKPILATLCLFTEMLRSPHMIEELAECIKHLDVDGYYVVLQAPNEEYIISDARWMIGFVKLIACLKLLRKKVIIAYTNHQSLVAAMAHVDAICSGNFMNTRRFEPKRFQSRKGDLDLRKSTWFFHPHALTEYKAALLDIAYDRNYLDSFRPLGDFRNEYSDMLFSGSLPSSTNYSEPNSFKHYLHCLRVLCESVTLDTYEMTKVKLEFMLADSERLIREYRTKGIKSQNRDFGIGIEALRMATSILDEDYGLRLELEWHRL